MSECDSSDQAVSVVVVGVNIFSFWTSSLKPLHGFASNFVWMFLGWTPTKCVKIRVLPLFFMELWVILCNFWPILKKSSIKPLTRNLSYLFWRVPRVLGKYSYESHTLFILYLIENHTLFGEKFYFIWKFINGNTELIFI